MDTQTLPPIDLTEIFKALSEPWKKYENSVLTKRTEEFRSNNKIATTPRRLKKRNKKL